MNINIWSPSVLAVIVGFILTVVGVLSKKAPTRKKLFMFGLPILGVALIVLFASASLPTGLQFLNNPLLGGLGKTATIGGTTITYSAVGNQPSNGNVNVNTYQPTASYSTIDHFGSTSVSGTSYYKAGSNKATTTAITNTDPNTNYQYWVSNTTYYVVPTSFLGKGTNTISNTNAFKNGSMTINAYDLINNVVASDTVSNVSLASGTAKIKYTVLGSATTSNMPLGGVLVVEANSSISQITCSGEGLSAGAGEFQLTYTPSATTTKYVVYKVAPGYDVSPDGLIGVTKTFECDFTSSTNPGTGSAYYVKMIPANYYYVNSDGSFDLNLEQAKNGVTTRVGLGGTAKTFYWG